MQQPEISIHPLIGRLLRIIECLKKSGLEIKDIKQFFVWVSEGNSSYKKRKELFEARKEVIRRIPFLMDCFEHSHC